MRASSDLDLNFLWGDGGAIGSWSSSAGLRSTFGSQLAEADRLGWHNPRGDEASSLAEYQAGLRRIPRTATTPTGDEAADPNNVEEQVISRLGSTTWARQIEARLRMLPRPVVDVLRLHYAGGSLPGGVDPCALALPEATELVLRQIERAHDKVTASNGKRKVTNPGEAAREAVTTLALIDRLREDRERVRRSLSMETLRDALQRAPQTEVEALEGLARLTLAKAKEAYEGTVLPKQTRRVL